jgi:ADP-ribose pyrophosphatase
MVTWTPNDDVAPIETKVGWRTVTRKEYFFPDGSPREFDLIGRQGDRGAIVLGLTTNNQVIVAEQFRPGPNKSMDELPGGMIEPGEDPEQAARREFREETGYEAGRMELLGTAHHDGFSIAPNIYFLAFDCQKVGEPTLDPNEWIVTKEMPIQDFLNSAKQGNVTDAAAVLMAHDRLQEIAAASKQ